MRKLIDLTGRKFGRLIVIKRVYPNTKWRQVRWLCKCDCGKENIVTTNGLRSGFIQSCGCLWNDKKRLSLGLASMRAIMGKYKANAKKAGIYF